MLRIIPNPLANSDFMDALQRALEHLGMMPGMVLCQ